MWKHERTRKVLSNTIGYFCICVFFVLTTYIVFVFYNKIVPSVLDKHAYGKFCFHFIFGNWLAINIYFNYLMAWLTSPGLAKHYQYLAVHFPVCKKCSFNKPPRTHHCSWCNLCILRYDHHCPWLNNCVGFYNHRYFYQFCCFMTIGCLYAGIFGYREYQISLLEEQTFGYIDSFYMAPDILYTMGIEGFITYYLFVIALVMGILLFLLVWWHGLMIGRGETSVERLLEPNYVEQYYQKGLLLVKISDTDYISNWKRFLGIRNFHDFIRSILLPSTHKPRGNGVTIDDYEVVMDPKFSKRKNSISLSSEGNSYSRNGYQNIHENNLINKYRSQASSWQRQLSSNSFKSCLTTGKLLTDGNRYSLISEI